MNYVFLFFYNAVSTYLSFIGVNLTDSVDVNMITYIISYIIGILLFAAPIYIIYKIIRSIF